MSEEEVSTVIPSRPPEGFRREQSIEALFHDEKWPTVSFLLKQCHGSTMLERRHLVILQEIDRQGSLTAAADTLCVTQSAVTHAIKRFEDQVGVALWERDGRRLRLTRSGRYLLTLADRVLPQFEQAEAILQDFARGRRGMLRIGMECHPCYRWLLRVVDPFLTAWPDVDVDVKQAFQFGGIGALQGFEIDLLITPDPIYEPALTFLPVFDYELVLVVGADHPLAGADHAAPEDLRDEVLVTYPVEPDRLDVYSQFLHPAGRRPKQRKVIETTDIMLQMVAKGRAVTTLPDWLVSEYARSMPIKALRLGEAGIQKSIHLGMRDEDAKVEFLQGFIEIAGADQVPPRRPSA